MKPSFAPLPIQLFRYWVGISIVLLLALSGGWLDAAARQESEQADTVVLAGEILLVPGTTEPIKNVALFIRNGRIIRIDKDVHPPYDAETESPQAKVIDLSCCSVVPGLIDTQTHLQSQRGMPSSAVRLTTWTDADNVLRSMVHARRTLEAGFTTIRDMGSHGDALFALRDAINAGQVPGPRLQVAGEIIQPTGGDLRAWFRSDVEQVFHTSATCDGADDCRRAVRTQLALGSDTIKVATKMDLVDGSPSQFSMEELKAIAQESHRHGVKVTASAFSADSINLPLEAGFDAVVHGTFTDANSIPLLRETSAYFIPTLVAARTVKEMAEDPEAPFSDAWRNENLAIYYGMIDSFNSVRKAGLKIAFGTDAGWRPHGGNGEQLVQMVELGMSPVEVLVSATVNAADAIGWQKDVGSLEIGKFADMVATELSPLDDISTLTRPRFVIKGGQIVFRSH